jgi:para-nitrobenzyl esterase
MRLIKITATMILSMMFAAAALAGSMTTDTTTLGELLDNPASKAVLVKHAPQLTQGGQIDQARPMTLKALQPFMADSLTDDVLTKIDADLAALK